MITKEEGMQLARELKQALNQRNIPVQKLYLFGSVALGKAHAHSDIDIAVVALPFRATQLEENVEVSEAREGIDLRIETVCLHPEDLENKYSTLATEIKRHGIPV